MKAADYENILDDLKRRRIPADVKKAVKALLEKKAERVVVLKLLGLSEMTDYLVICHGQSARQNKALSDAVRETLKKESRLRPLGIEGERAAEWILVDYMDFIINIFSEASRQKFALEKLWMDAKRYDFHADS
jgi:ribosome-associated protein